MQLMLIAGIAFAIGAVLFALQNNVPVTVAFALWRFDSTLAVVLLIALGLGALIAAVVVGLGDQPLVVGEAKPSTTVRATSARRSFGRWGQSGRRTMSGSS